MRLKWEPNDEKKIPVDCSDSRLSFYSVEFRVNRMREKNPAGTTAGKDVSWHRHRAAVCGIG